MEKKACMLALALALISAPVMAQSYSYSYGNGRVLNESDTGLARPSGSYIGSGTMSKSAQGINAPSTISNPGLPAVNMGANIRTPGDNMYRPKPQNNGLPRSSMGANVGTPGDGMRSDLHYYVPGQNNSRRTYPGQGQGQRPQFYYKPGSGGVATYGEQSTGSGDNGARHF